MFKQVSLGSTPSKCLFPLLQVNWSGHDLDSALTLTLKTLINSSPKCDKVLAWVLVQILSAVHELQSSQGFYGRRCYLTLIFDPWPWYVIGVKFTWKWNNSGEFRWTMSSRSGNKGWKTTRSLTHRQTLLIALMDGETDGRTRRYIAFAVDSLMAEAKNGRLSPSHETRTED